MSFVRGSQAYLAVLEHAETFQGTLREATDAALDFSEEEDKPVFEEEVDYSGPGTEDHLSEISVDDDKQGKVDDKQDVVPAENELPILCRCRADLQDGRHVILSSRQTLEEWQAVASIRARVEQKLRDAGVFLSPRAYPSSSTTPSGRNAGT